VSEPLGFDNGCSITMGVGIHLNSAAEITIAGGRIYASPHPAQPSCKQPLAVLLSRNSNAVGNDRIRILDVDTAPAFMPSRIVTADAGAASSRGFYRLQGRGVPAPSWMAPNGSQFTDLSSGRMYRRVLGSWLTP